MILGFWGWVGFEVSYYRMLRGRMAKATKVKLTSTVSVRGNTSYLILFLLELLNCKNFSLKLLYHSFLYRQEHNPLFH